MTSLNPPRFDAVLSGAGAPPAGRLVHARFERNQLWLGDDDDDGGAVDCAMLVVSVGGIDRPELCLNWLAADGRQTTLKPLAETDIATVLASAPSALQPLLMQWRQRNSPARQAWGWIGAAVALCVLPLALAWWQAPHLVSWLAGKIPQPLEEKLGQAALAQIRAEGGLLEKGPAQEMVQEIGARLTAGSTYRYRWIVKQDASVNAFAMPGGIVVVHTGLLEKSANLSELAGVLAHEVQHIEQRHSLKQLISSLGWGALMTVTLGDISAITAVIAHQAGTLYFSRDMEEEADRLGFQALLRAGIKPDGMLAFFRKLEQEQTEKNGTAALPDWLSSHPQTAQRSARIEAMLAQQPCPACRCLEGAVVVAPAAK